MNFRFSSLFSRKETPLPPKKTDENAPRVEVRHLSVRFGNFYAVNNINFTVKKGEIFGFLGANGAGKTTTIRVLCGLLPQTEGTVLMDGNIMTEGEKIKQKVGYMSQHFTLYNDLSIQENFDFAASLRKLSNETYQTNLHKLFDFIGFKPQMNLVVKDLPDGIKQEIALCVALLHDPEIIFLDEPTAGVAPVVRFRFWKLIRALADKGKTVFVTTHYMDEAENCGRIALMKDGKLIALGSPEELKNQAFKKPIYLLTPKKNEPVDTSLFEMIEPYGLHYHVIFKDGVDIPASLPKIRPSLEDVFIKFVENK